MQASIAAPTPALAKRTSKLSEIVAFFVANLGKPFSTAEMHLRFGPSFRARVSDIRSDPSCPIRILNTLDSEDHSLYWSEVKKLGQQQRLFVDDAPLRHRDLG